jgi:hypothetical protein
MISPKESPRGLFFLGKGSRGKEKGSHNRGSLALPSPCHNYANPGNAMSEFEILIKHNKKIIAMQEPPARIIHTQNNTSLGLKPKRKDLCNALKGP